MSKFAYIGAAASLLLICASARAEWRTPIAGAPPILPTRFERRLPRPITSDQPGVSFLGTPPQPTRGASAGREVTIPSSATPAALRGSLVDAVPDSDAPIQWIAPLVDRRLTPIQRSADIAPELIDAILRIEPMYDPTRLYGAGLPARMGVSSGTATMDNVFADHWRRADLDANVNQRVPYIAMAWHRRTTLPCDAFIKNRARGYNQPALTALSRGDCATLQQTEARGAAAILAPIVAGAIAVPTFAAPMPGSRMSSVAFWAARRAEIARAEEELRLRHVWHGGKEGIGRSFAKR